MHFYEYKTKEPVCYFTQESFIFDESGGYLDCQWLTEMSWDNLHQDMSGFPPQLNNFLEET